MLLKRIQAPTLPEALAKVERECGTDALLVETKQTKAGYLIVAARSTGEQLKRPHRTTKRWTRGFAELAERAGEFGLGTAVLAAIENAMVRTSVHLDRPGDPAVPRVAGRILKSLIKTTECDTPEYRVTTLVGPTGVGKTTTLAKLAAQSVNELHEDVAILTVDTYRVAAVEQLRAFADMLGADFEVAFTPVDLRRAVQRYAGKDRVFIDTTGRSPFDQDSLRALSGCLDGTRTAVALCLAAGTRRRDAEAVLDGFADIGADCIVLTKWDETHAPGEPLSCAIEHDIPLSHVTIGQRVPEDIVPADAGALAASAFALDEQTAENVL